MRGRALHRALGPAVLAAALTLPAACDKDDAPDDVVQHPRAEAVARITPVVQALANAEVAKLDPATMNDAEIRLALGTGPRCEFRYTSSGRPVLAVAEQPEPPQLRAIVKLNGHLVYLASSPTEGAADPDSRLLMTAGPLRLTLLPGIAPDNRIAGVVPRREADMVFEAGSDLRAGYSGYLNCGPVAEALQGPDPSTAPR